MNVLESLAARPLSRAAIDQLRARDIVTAFIELESPGRIRQNGGLERAIALIEGEVVNLTFEDGTWTRTVLAREADQRRHLDEALKQVGQDKSAESTSRAPANPWK